MPKREIFIDLAYISSFHPFCSEVANTFKIIIIRLGMKLSLIYCSITILKRLKWEKLRTMIFEIFKTLKTYICVT